MLDVEEQVESADSMVGRSWELDAVLSKIELVRYSLSSVVTIEGASGIGKTRLMQELMNRCEGLGLRSSIWAAVATPQSELQAMAILKSLQPLTDTHRSLAEMSLDATYQDEVALAAVLTRKIETLCRARGQDKLVLFVEDGQWMDAVSAAVLRRLVLQSYLPVCVVLSTRRVFSAHKAGIETLLSLRETTRVRLQPMSDDIIAQLISEMSLDRALSPAWLSWCQRIAGGNPMYAQALARAAAEELQEDRRDPDEIVMNPKLAIGENVRGDQMLQRRIAALKDAEREILAAASVVGLSFSVDSVVRLTKRTSDEVSAALSHGYRHGIVEKLFDNTWKFSHPLVSSVLLKTLDDGPRRQLRRQRIVQMKADSNVSALERAEQMILAGMSNEAVKIYVSEARNAARIGAHREAAALFRRADSIAISTEAKRLLVEDDARLARIRALFAISNYEEAVPLLRSEMRARDAGRFSIVLDWFRSGLVTDKTLRHRFDEETRVLGVLARHYTELAFFQNRFMLLCRAGVRTVIESHWTEHKNERGLSLAHASFLASIFGLRRLGDVLMDMSSSNIREEWNIAGLVEHALISNIRLSHLGEYRQVEASTSAALEWLDEHEDPLRLEMVLALRSLSHLLRGDVVTAERWHTQCLASARVSRNIQATLWSLSTLIYCKVTRGVPCHDHVVELKSVLKQTVPIGDRLYAEAALAVWAETHGKDGRWDELIDKISASPVGPYFLIMPIDSALANLIRRARAVRGDERRTLVNRAIKLMIRVAPNIVSNPPIKTPLFLRLAELASLLGHDSVAKWAAEQSKKSADTYDMYMYGLLADAAHPDVDAATLDRIDQELRIALGSQWQADRLEEVRNQEIENRVE